jgi:hypothetical protein
VPAKIEALDFAGASDAIDAALRTGALGPKDVARAYVLRGVIAASKRDATHAEREFERALRIDAATALPAGVAPHVAAPFERARAAAPPPLDARASVAPTDAAHDAIVHVAVTEDPDHLARRAVVRARGGTVDAPIAGDGADVVVGPRVHGCAPIRVRLLDAFGNDLFDSGDVVVRCAAVPAPGAAAATPASRAVELTSRPVPGYAWAGVAITGAGAVTSAVLGAFALSKRATFESANVDPTRVAQRQSLHDDAAGAERLATVAAVATAVAGAVTTALVVFRPTVTTRVTVGAAPTPQGGALVVGARF